tara:strand:- start:149 stop:490 length:342 start_codon:yes stop_codon:yes gene_type:complete
MKVKKKGPDTLVGSAPKKTKTVSKDGDTFTTSKDTSTGEKKRIVSYKTNEDGTVTKTVTKTKDEDYLAGSKKRPVSKSSSKVKREKTISAEKAARQKARREKRAKNNAEMRNE